MSFLAKSCSRKTLEISFRECKSVTECSDRWITVHKDGINSERIERSHPYSMEKLTINGRARVCGQYKCTSTCDKQSVTRFLFLKGKAGYDDDRIIQDYAGLPIVFVLFCFCD